MSREFLNTSNLSVVQPDRLMTKVFYFETNLHSVENTSNTSNNSIGFEQIIVECKSEDVKLEKQRIQSHIHKGILLNLNHLGVDGQEVIKSQLLRELEQKKNIKLFNNYKVLGDQNFKTKLTKFQTFIQKWFKNYKFVFYIENTNALIAKIYSFSNQIGKETRMGYADFIVTSGKILSLLKEDPSFVPFSVQRESGFGESTIYQVGTIGNLKVFTSMYIPYSTNLVLLGQSSSKHNNAGTFVIEDHMPFIKIIEFENEYEIILEYIFTIWNQPNAMNKYMAFEVSFNKKPLWKKLLNL